MNLDHHIPISESFLVRLQFLCLFMAGILEFLALAFAHYITHVLLHLAMLGPVCLFWIAAFMQMRKNKIKYPLGLVLAMVVWFCIIQQFPRTNQVEIHHFGLFFSVYLLAFPFALVAQDENRQIGLKMTAMFYIAAALFLVFYTVLLIADYAPAFLENNFSFFWDGTRLNAMLHPNVSARVFMIGIAFCLGFSVHTSKKHIKALLLAAAALMFISLSLTNSRAAILLTCLLFAGTVFFGIFKGTWKQFIIGAAAGLTVMITLFLTAQWLYQWNSTRLTTLLDAQQNYILQVSTENHNSSLPQASYKIASLPDFNDSVLENAENLELTDSNDAIVPLSAVPAADAPPVSANPQGSLIDDLPTLNNRTKIWHAALQGIKEDPSILLWGTDRTKEIVGQVGGTHTHNAWLEILFRLGLPGFVMSLLFTGQAVWSSICLLCHSQVSMWKKIISLLMLCLLVSAMLEPSLFFTIEMWHSTDFIFFLCLGYTIQWRKQLSKAKVATS